MKRPSIPLAAALFAAFAAAPAAADTLDCTSVATLPAVISQPGHYCLNANASQAFVQAAVTINASNVVFDCNDHTVTQTGSAAVNGITVNNRSQVTVRNCALANFGRGIVLFETVAGSSRNNRVERNDVRRARLTGIQVGGSANVIERNRVSENLGGAGAATYGILVNGAAGKGAGNLVRDNFVSSFAPALYVDVVGIYLLDVAGTAVVGNTIGSLYPPAGKSAYGLVASPASLNGAAVENVVLAATGVPAGGTLAYTGSHVAGIRFDAPPTETDGNVCRANSVGRFATDIVAESPSGGCHKEGNAEF
jgi:parallel beta-helix repeat protein